MDKVVEDDEAMWFAFYLTGVLASLVGSVYYSISARSRALHPVAARMTLGKMNMCLGALLLLFGSNQFTFDELTTARIAVGLMFIAVGLINLIMGTRNYVANRREWLAIQKKDR